MLEIVRRLTPAEQRDVLEACRRVIEQAPLFRKVMPSGAAYRYLCTSAGRYGWISDRRGYRYVEAHPVTGRPFPAIPQVIGDIARDAARACGLMLKPETALMNWYDVDSRLGLHQDKTEISRAPVVSISLGDDCIFVAGGQKRNDPKSDMLLRSGDVLLMGAGQRLIFHGVKKILPGTAPPALGLKKDGRLNITVRQVYE